MAIEGPLRELALPDVLQLLHLSRKTGTLAVRADAVSRPGLVLFDRGAVVGARAPGESTRLGRLLLMAGKATAAQIERALEEQRASGARLGQILVEREGVAPGEVQRQLRFQVEETLSEMIRWTDGFFRFDEGTPPDPGPLRLRLPTEMLLMEALRRMDEWSALASGQPDTSLVPRLVEQGEDAALSLQPVEWEVLAGIDGERSLGDLAREVGRAEFEVARAVYGLVSAGVVELGRRTARAPLSPRRPAEEGGAGEVEALLREGRIEEAERKLGELARWRPEAAEVLLLRGRLEARRGSWAGAVEALESAIRRDPLLSPAYYHLGLAAVRVGALARAEECLETFARLPDARAPERERAARVAALVAELRQLTGVES